METGHRSGSRFQARPGEPRPEFYPARRTVTGRRLTKIHEWKALGMREARQLGLESVSERAAHGLAGPADADEYHRLLWKHGIDW
ncbi:hypothetical protein [Streptomyces sp. NK08204]|uniref:hypothetical protein n=1 Tax=Streptomyces sp. NK08204 TaxID=2873260 RepID=UPI0035A94FB0